jgi:hypothetical protein
VTGDFINGSSANSILAIIYSTDSRNDVYYKISSPSTAEEKLVTNISGLPSGLYNVSVFVLEENGLPFSRSATTPRSVLVGDNQGEENGEQCTCMQLCRADLGRRVGMVAENFWL